MANGSMSTNTSSEGEIRKSIVEGDLVDCMIALPGQLFYTTQIPVCLWFISRNKKNGRFRNRCGQTLFIDARKMGTLIDRVHRELSDDEIDKIAITYHAWRLSVCGDAQAGGDAGANVRTNVEANVGANLSVRPEGYKDIPGICKSVETKEIKDHGYVLTPGRYVGAEAVEDDGIPFEDKMTDLSAMLYEQFTEAQELDKVIRKNLAVLGFGK